MFVSFDFKLNWLPSLHSALRATSLQVVETNLTVDWRNHFPHQLIFLDSWYHHCPHHVTCFFPHGHWSLHRSRQHYAVSLSVHLLSWLEQQIHNSQLKVKRAIMYRYYWRLERCSNENDGKHKRRLTSQRWRKSRCLSTIFLSTTADSDWDSILQFLPTYGVPAWMWFFLRYESEKRLRSVSPDVCI